MAGDPYSIPPYRMRDADFAVSMGFRYDHTDAVTARRLYRIYAPEVRKPDDVVVVLWGSVFRSPFLAGAVKALEYYCPG